MMTIDEYRRSNTRLADFLPWAALVDEVIILNKDGSFTDCKVPGAGHR